MTTAHRGRPKTGKKNRRKLDITSVTNNTRLKIQVSGNVRDMIVLLRMQTAENATKKAILLLYVALVK